MRVGWVRIGDFRPISRRISETVGDTTKVTQIQCLAKNTVQSFAHDKFLNRSAYDHFRRRTMSSVFQELEEAREQHTIDV